MSIKVAKATSLQLDWLVAKCEGKSGILHDDGITRCIVIAAASGLYKGTFKPSTNWAQGGQIIERERISIIRLEDTIRTDSSGSWIPGRNPIYGAVLDDYFGADTQRNGYGETGEDIFYIAQESVAVGTTPLIAAMRCFVVSKLGEEADIPEGML
jgi:hypothetical protein